MSTSATYVLTGNNDLVLSSSSNLVFVRGGTDTIENTSGKD
jgi:hypothetical protein